MYFIQRQTGVLSAKVKAPPNIAKDRGTMVVRNELEEETGNYIRVIFAILPSETYRPPGPAHCLRMVSGMTIVSFSIQGYIRSIHSKNSREERERGLHPCQSPIGERKQYSNSRRRL